MATINNNILSFSGSLQHKRATQEILEASDYVPAAGEIVIAIDTGVMKAGDGEKTWAELPSAGDAIDSINGIDCGEITAPDEGE